jgi:hypothetical protein
VIDRFAFQLMHRFTLGEAAMMHFAQVSSVAGHARPAAEARVSAQG